MIVIFKYLLKPGITAITIPARHGIRAVHEQDGRAYVWIEHEEPHPDSERVQVRIVRRETGERFDAKEAGDYLGTVFGINGYLVYHFYLL